MKGPLKIGLMDSGMGGLSVLKGILKYDAELEVVYYGDLKNSPYGEKETSEILELVRDVCKRLQEENVSAILLACNTATSAAAQTLRKEFSIPIFGMEPAIKPAILQNPGKKIALLATPVTQREKKLQRLKAELGAEELILPVSCPGLAGLVDKGEFDEAEKYLRPILKKLREENVENLVLGCTHYIFLKHIILKNFPNVRIYDGNSGTIKHLLNSLQVRQRVSNRSSVSGSVYKLILNSDEELHFRLATELLQFENKF
ncbi:glutamate racemase [Leptospira borgpetersenii]|uniref:Glutamate racemase n=3 Tax=Leptospira borgpetersenii serovar Hardjo-bovis TaxID=338217 RepID=MURI_LEPBJ|nr:glutamate racemase [Leptospira borgpetersenii]Q04QQ5.1 RecName: Full=Glutamate racemase [Leptospira borgpetersenii serovar Hardjo-bovis str. JB197]Q053X4.1 RecName: Full=Glutamate racemase [Leptospira borgpetersenii serovar Hardjo-bovis str. L550]ABJ76765.1 Glutamate racemase [Leptospira borgpetersenii serovar Hardjo-bovis str. JB197]ABJ78371.1 Glutamate racemase [Leptospira borgpetersenii serovar Hardjo-bovis str. L550]AMX57598.1 glutamate racemase [Leptospira borgpetersenii serovar Hardjo